MNIIYFRSYNNCNDSKISEKYYLHLGKKFLNFFLFFCFNIERLLYNI